MTGFDDILSNGPWQAALDGAKPYSVFHLPAGEIHEKLVVRTPGLKICGCSAEQTKLVWDDYAKKTDRNGLEYNTFRTWTLAVCANDVTLSNLSVCNTAGNPSEKGQEVALSVCSDGFHAENCAFLSTQDTVFFGALPPDLQERYADFLPEELRRPGPYHANIGHCLIEGSVDYVFGCGEVILEGCELRNVYDGKNVGYVAAPAHSPEQIQGFDFIRCRFTADSAVADSSIYLARPWRDYGLSRFIDCTIGKHISPLGFDKWRGTNRDQTARFYESPSVPGRVSWVKEAI